MATIWYWLKDGGDMRKRAKPKIPTPMIVLWACAAASCTHPAAKPQPELSQRSSSDTVPETDPSFSLSGPPGAKLGLDANHAFTVVIELNASDTTAFAAFSRQNIGRKIVLIANGRIISNAILTDAVTDGRLQIAGSLTWHDADAIVRRIKG